MTGLALVVGAGVGAQLFFGRLAGQSAEFALEERWATQFLNLGRFCDEVRGEFAITSTQNAPSPTLGATEEHEWGKFQDPYTGLKYDWVIVKNGTKSYWRDSTEKIPLVAAPWWGPERTKGKILRLVGYADGRIEWMEEKKFVELTCETD